MPSSLFGIFEREPLELAPKPKQLLLGPESGFGCRGFQGEPAAQPEGEIFEIGVGLGRGAEHLQAFVFAHRIRFRRGELPQPYHLGRGIPPSSLPYSVHHATLLSCSNRCDIEH